MHFFINELSFIGQAKDVYEAEKFIAELYSIIEKIQPLQQDKPVQTHSNIANKRICSDLTLHQWFNQKINSTDRNGRTVAIFFLKILRKGTFIDQQEVLKYCQCYLENQDVQLSSVSGAAHYQGVLISLKNSPCFSDHIVQIKFGYEQQELQNLEITNLTEISQANGIRRHYQPSPKHRQMGERGVKDTRMDLSDEKAQIALDKGIAHGRQIYSYYNEKFYEFKSDNAGGHWFRQIG